MPLIPKYRLPTHPGEMLLEEFLKPRGITQRDLAAAIGVPYQRINKLVNGKGRVTAGLPYRLSQYIGATPEFWLNLQMVWDLYHAQRSEAADLEKIRPLVWDDFPEPEDLAETPAAAEVAAG